MMGNKRQYRRAKFNWPVTVIKDNLTIQGRVQNLSRGGALINIYVELFPSEHIRMAIEIPEYDDVISAKGEVIRCIPVKAEKGLPFFRAGVRFTEISKDDLRYFTGNLAPEWQDDYQDPPINYQKPPIIKRPQGGFSLKILCGLLGLLLLSMIFYSLRPTIEYQKEIRDIESIENRVHLLETRFLQMNQNKIPVQALEEQIKRMQDKLKKLENEWTDELTGDALPAELGRQERKSVELDEEIKTLPEVLTKAPAQVVSEKTPPVYHIVRNGENLYRISLRYGLTIEEILKLNNLASGTSIVLGQKLLVKPGE